MDTKNYLVGVFEKEKTPLSYVSSVSATTIDFGTLQNALMFDNWDMAKRFALFCRDLKREIDAEAPFYFAPCKVEIIPQPGETSSDLDNICAIAEKEAQQWENN